MKHAFTLPARLSAFLLLACSSTTSAHTWIEQLSIVASNGTFIGITGYPRGFVARTAGVDPDEGMTYLLPPNGRSTGNTILPTDLMCKSSQTVGTQTPGSPALIASAGDQIALRYQENGHVTQPQIPVGKPEGSGTVYVYGTEKSENSDTYLGIHNVWNAAGTGGDGRGVLLATRHFDDGQCYQINGGPISQARQKEFPHQANSLMGEDLWCQTDVQIPGNATGNYTLYWVWDWPTLNANGLVILNQSYTTCMDIVLAPSKDDLKATTVNFASGQNIDYAGIAAQLSSPFLVNPTSAEQTFVSGSALATFTSSVVIAPSTVTSQRISTAGGLITVTLTANVAQETVTITKTETVNGGALQSTSTPAFASTHTSLTAQSTATLSPLLSNSPSTSTPKNSLAASSSSTQQPAAPQPTPSGSEPPIMPFLSPSSQIAKAPAPASTLLTSQTPSQAQGTASVAATSDCPDMTPGAISSATPTLAPSQSATPYSNGTVHVRAFKLRGRSVVR